MSLSVPRHASQLPVWYEEVVRILNPLPDVMTRRADTVNATPTTILSLPLVDDAIYLIEWTVIARQTAGSAGTVGHGAAYRRMTAASLVSGTATVIGSTASIFTAEDDAAWDVGVSGSGNRLMFTVTGAANKTIGWRLEAIIRRMGG